jgi:tetratricopeptide (TPR) repeat protein
MQELLLKRVYHHFKGDYYLVEDVARHSETGEEYVIYRKLYGDGSLWIRPKEMFLSPVDREKYPNCEQAYRFQLQEIESVADRGTPAPKAPVQNPPAPAPRRDNIVSLTLQRMTDLVDELVEEYADENGFYNPSLEEDLAKNLAEFLTETACGAMQKGLFSDAFGLTVYGIRILQKLDFHDPENLKISMTACECIWNSLYLLGSEEQRDILLGQILSLSLTEVPLALVSLLSLLSENFLEPGQLRQKMQWLDEQIRQLTESDIPEAAGFCAAVRLRCMQELGSTPKELEAYQAPFHREAPVRGWLIDYYTDRQDYARAMQVLEESMGLDSENTSLIACYQQSLCSLYQKTGQIEKLMDTLLSLRSITLLDTYEPYLRSQFSAQLRDVYAEFVQGSIQYAENRADYQDLIGYLQKIASYPGGKVVAMQIARNWKLAYTRRKALADELAKAGF